MHQKITLRFIAVQALIAALYSGLTILLHPISYGTVQIRISEALTLLPYINPSCIVGITAGCFISNIVGGYGVLDIIFGTAATFIAGILTSRCKNKYLAAFSPITVNAFVIGALISYITAPENLFFKVLILNIFQIGAGEAIAVFVFGLPLLRLLDRTHLSDRLRKE